MPTPRAHGGAPLTHFPLTIPGFKGLNTEDKGALLGPEWATRLENTSIDSSNRIAARKGWANATSSAYGSKFVSGIEYRKMDGTTQLLAIAATTVAASTDNGSTWSNVTGTASFTDGNWHLVNFNNYVVGFQSGKAPLSYNGTTSSHVADVNAPSGGVGTAAFGRVWGFKSDGVTLAYSVLLTHTDFTNAGSGTFNLTNVWPDTDTGAAIAAYNNSLVVFGKRNIVIFSDGTGSTIGLNPTNARVIDTIPGVGCISQESIQLVNGDLWFVNNSRQLVSLNRVLLEQRSGQVSNLSPKIASELRDSIDNGSFSLTRMRSTFSPKDRFYLLSLPTESSAGAGDEVGKVFAFDTRQALEDGSFRCVGIWNQLVPTAFWQRADGSLYMSKHTVTGKVGTYSSAYLDNGSTYRMIYESGWLDVLASSPGASGLALILKRIEGRFLFELVPTVTVKWAFDFGSVFKTKDVTFTSTGTASLWGQGLWGTSLWGAGISLGNKRVAGSGTGQYIKIGSDIVINGGAFAIQQFDLFTKIGRLVG